ncbi:hypothetical protein BKP37_12470 [Anaerobacillus alkalilacustris]|uniref:GAF domain-containing protein n=1 Tax=Anaerobacillus alkalilacustris TaxID=393763 RepID=A0A1S2LNR5_9BACI|nr:hypothetical protein [Anaerobacillus alkalilacustris]OIJ13307.1 hypothetical protein BKP37_12470 [Anaerobacillus alkalilacustris]
MNKSDKLDELRLEIGMIADKVNSRHEFYLGIITTIARHVPEYFGVAIYQCIDNCYSIFASYGNISENLNVKFGDGMFSICSIRGKVTIHNELYATKAYAPFYNEQHVIGVLYVEVHNAKYQVTDEDRIFLQEVTRYIEVRGKQYENSIVDNNDV